MSFAAALARLPQPEPLLLVDRWAYAKHGAWNLDYDDKTNHRPI